MLSSFLAIAHFIGDFPLQTEWMASGKSKSVLPLAVHVVVYTLAFAAILWLLALFAHNVWFLPMAFTAKRLALFSIFNGASHFLVDMITSRVTGWAWREKKVRLFFTVIGADQLVHYLIMLASAPLLLV